MKENIFNLGHLALLLTAIIFGFGFLFQAHAAKQAIAGQVGVFTLWFVFSRSVIAVLFVLGLIYYRNGRAFSQDLSDKNWLIYGAISGVLFACGMFLQQGGLAYTTVSKSGFITSLYVVLVPIVACVFGKDKKPSRGLWWAVLIMFVGLCCFAGVRADDINAWNWGDSLTLCSAFCFALQVVFLGLIVHKTVLTALLLGQFMTVALFAALMLIVQGQVQVLLNTDWYRSCFVDILVTGLGSSGIAFLLQTYGQRRVPTAHAALILAFEAVFAAIFAWFVYDERMSLLMFIGAGLMLCAIVLAEVTQIRSTAQNS